MRRAGQNPTESEVQDMINSVDVDGSGFVEFPEFCNLMHKKISDADTENELKETFRVFSKDDEGKNELKYSRNKHSSDFQVALLLKNSNLY